MFSIVSIVLLSGLVIAGCASSPEYDEEALAAYLQDKPDELRGVFGKVVTEGERNHVLNRLRAGVAAMDAGHGALAARAFDEVLLTIETLYGGDEEAAKARGLFSAEDRKVFRGEPYERAMAYYYRGILHLKDGDYENARASFKSGSLQDTLAEQEEFQQDFALLEYLEGWASQCNGDVDLASEAYTVARRHDNALAIPHAEDNLLVLAELGYAPVKYAAGEHGELFEDKGKRRRRSGIRQRSPGRPLRIVLQRRKRPSAGGDAGRTGIRFHSRGQGELQGVCRRRRPDRNGGIDGGHQRERHADGGRRLRRHSDIRRRRCRQRPPWAVRERCIECH